MGLWNRYVMPALVSCGCASPAMRYYRKRVVPQATGRVLELGCGSGLNFSFYDPARVTALTAVEPDPRMLGWAAERRDELSGIPVDLIESGIEDAGIADESVDTAVVTFVLCTIPDWRSSLNELRRVLKPGGQILFCEHGLAPDADVARWQRRIEPIWKRLAGGCHLTRSVSDQLDEGGFEVPALEAGYTPKTPRVAGYVSWGRAALRH
ncbi:MAG: class I SAM-dependent methyltransferase [Pseudomonadota bacterium]